jgi:NitT/TauT family transport system permease protein
MLQGLKTVSGGRPSPGASSRQLAGRALAQKVLAGTSGLVAFALAWELVARVSGIAESTFPRALTVLSSMLGLLVDVDFLTAVGETLWSSLLGLLLALLIGVPLGVAMGSSPVTYRATNTLVETIRPVPSVALIPVALLAFGVGLQFKVFLVTFTVTWTILLNTIYAVRDVDPLLKETARSFGLSRSQIVTRIVLPSAAPFIYTGVRIGAVAAVLVTVAAELLAGGSGGLGQWLSRQQNAVTLNHLVYAGALLSGVVGVIINIALDRGEQRFFGWHSSVRGVRG